MEVTQSNRLETGTYLGEIIAWEASQRGGPEYVDLKIGTKEGGRRITMTTGYPLDLNESGRLAQLFRRFGTRVVVGEDVDVPAVLNKMVGAAVVFKVAPDPRNAEFQRIDPRSVCPSSEA